MAAVANGGKLMEPHVIKSITDPTTKTTTLTEPKMIRQVISEETSRKVGEYLEQVVSDQKIGTVERVHFGAVSQDADTHGGGPATAPSPGSRENSLIEDFAKAIAAGDEMPEPLRQRLLRHGFIRIDSTGLFAADRYVMPDQIANVSEDRVMLRVTRDELIKR